MFETKDANNKFMYHYYTIQGWNKDGTKEDKQYVIYVRVDKIIEK